MSLGVDHLSIEDIEKIKDLAVDGCSNDGHKQWYLEQIVKMLVPENEFKLMSGYHWEPGMPP